MKALIISTNALGDTYLSASAIPVLRNQLGISQVDVVAPIGATMFLETMNVHQAYYLRDHTWSSLLSSLASVRSVFYDQVFSFFPGFFNSVLLLASRGRQKAGYLTFRPIVEWYDVPHRVYANRKAPRLTWEPEMKYLDLVMKSLQALGIETPRLKKPVLRIGKGSQQRFKESVVIHSLSRSPAKSFCLSTLKDIVSFIVNDLKRQVVLLGGNNDVRLLETIAPGDGRVSVSINPPINELLDMILLSHYFVGVDSFPLHIADAHDGRFVGIFGPTNPLSALEHSDRAIHCNVANLRSVSGEAVVQKLRPFLA
jgi:ADP-heptose:LPS heptosyltransferase